MRKNRIGNCQQAWPYCCSTKGDAFLTVSSLGVMLWVWFDNKPVAVLSTVITSTTDLTASVYRWTKKKGEWLYLNIFRPVVTGVYNAGKNSFFVKVEVKIQTILVITCKQPNSLFFVDFNLVHSLVLTYTKNRKEKFNKNVYVTCL